MQTDYYTALGVPYNATPEEIRNAYFQHARTLHPDVNPDPAVRETFLHIQQAYEVLSNPQRRTSYDASLPAEMRMAPEISVNVRYSRSVFPSLSEPQLAYVLVEMFCTADVDPRALPASHVCLVLDRSTSMQGERMDMVKVSALNLLQQLRSQDVLSVVTFSDRADVLIPPTRASLLSKSDHRVNMIHTGGGTEILQGLVTGMEQLRKTDNSFHRHLILLTDGYTYGDDEGCLQLAQEAAQEGITINVLGIGSEWNDGLMDQVASLSGGNSMYVASGADLDNFLMQKMNDLETLYARGLRFAFESSPGVQLRYAFRLTPNIGPLATESPIALGDIQHKRSISLLLEFLIPPATDVTILKLARGQVRMEIPSRKSPNHRILLDISRPVRANVEPEAPPSVIIEAMSKLTLYRLQEKVRQEVSAGQIEKATRHMQHLATHLLAQGDRELAHAVLLEAEHIQQSRKLSGEGEKRIKYATRALMLPSGPEIKQ